MNNKVLGNGELLEQSEVMVPAMGMATLLVDFSTTISKNAKL